LPTALRRRRPGRGPWFVDVGQVPDRDCAYIQIGPYRAIVTREFLTECGRPLDEIVSLAEEALHEFLANHEADWLMGRSRGQYPPEIHTFVPPRMRATPHAADEPLPEAMVTRLVWRRQNAVQMREEPMAINWTNATSAFFNNQYTYTTTSAATNVIASINYQSIYTYFQQAQGIMPMGGCGGLGQQMGGMGGWYQQPQPQELGTWDQVGTWPAPAPLIPEQQEAIRVWQEQENARAEKAAAELQAAEEKAQALIEEILAADELKQLREQGFVDVAVKNAAPRGEDPRKWQKAFAFYRIRANAGIDLIDSKGRVSGYICIHTCDPEGVLPPSDDLLSKWWTAKCDEERLWKVGNFSLR
jgi:hypothetical protein